jgi:hypothetical protein
VLIALAAAGLVAAAVAAVVVVSSGSDGGGDGDARLAAACRAHVEATEGFNRLFDETAALQRGGPPPKSSTAQIQANFDRFVAGPLARLRRNAPAPIAKDIESAIATTQRIRRGDLSGAMAPAYSPTAERIDGYFFDNCGGARDDVEGVDFAFDGLEPTQPRGLLRIKFVNGGSELHELRSTSAGPASPSRSGASSTGRCARSAPSSSGSTTPTRSPAARPRTRR